jgi:hypothetical protein
VTRDNWLDINYGGIIPENYGAEHEAMLPSYLQDFDKIGETRRQR